MLALRGLLLVIAACRVAVAKPPAPVYDQRQTGDLNVQIELKDVQVVALLNSELLDDYTDYDYFYDYADFTLKPGNRPTTTSPATSTTEKNDIMQVSEPIPSQNSTVSASAGDTSPSASDATPSKDEEAPPPDADPSNGTASDTTPSKDEGIPNADRSNGTASSTPNADNDKGQPSEEEDGVGTAPSTTVKAVHALRSQKRCKSGYVPNGNGRCRRASRPWLTRLLP
ncbi:uncharacterized protein LOC112460218 [Temnothorax curvispinosus]|uniref:Uncharacterized protein LOC112460218 n=1 Tax=Temnothorax curvispinosus TaxID=300111 RepID=A0A6J1QE38_9HYME|nr:uncharacterized protein LOC112460218 [Temnothorax curvispinosus]